MSLSGIWAAGGGYLAFFIAGFLVSEPWRWAGALLGRDIDPTSAIFAWVRAVATAIVAALCARLIMFPTGVLADVGLGLRLAALAAGIGAYLLSGRRLGVGIAVSLGLLLVGPAIGA
jgi:hypothetical protein